MFSMQYLPGESFSVNELYRVGTHFGAFQLTTEGIGEPVAFGETMKEGRDHSR